MPSDSSGSPSVANTTVVVPVHGAPGVVAECIAALERHAEGEQVLLIDDASRDDSTRPQLEEARRRNPGWALHIHPQRRGYTATINAGCALARDRDVVLLNSDTRVTKGWLAGIVAVAATDPKIATVTPLSNNAGPFSVPYDGPAPNISIDDARMAALVAKWSPGLSPEVPTGHGFCLFVRRAALAAVGSFDEKAFPEGAGEENDFCVRATALGMRHVLADSVYVFHHGSRSIGWKKRWLLWRGLRVLKVRHPDYLGSVSQFLEADPLAGLRAHLQTQLSGH